MSRPPPRKASISGISSMSRPLTDTIKSVRKSDGEIARIKNRNVRLYYERQNRTIDRFEEVDAIINGLNPATTAPVNHDDEESSVGIADGSSRPLLPKQSSSESTSQLAVHLAINASFAINFVLFITKILVAFTSGSLSVLASTFESFLDLLSNGIIFYTVRIIKKRDYYNYPVGKSRMEPLGIIVFAVITATSFTQVLISSVERLADPTSGSEALDLSPLSITVLIANIVVKAALWAWCSSIKGSSSVQALAQDHENDVVFNVVSTVFAIIANISSSWWWIDPVGGILLSLYIIYEWMVTLLDNIRNLTGHTASPDDIKQLTYMAYRFSPLIEELDTVRAYYVGDRLFVEVDVVMPPDCPLQRAHDVGEALQNALERMENVERAFVHLDYNSQHAIEHREVVSQIGYMEG